MKKRVLIIALAALLLLSSCGPWGDVYETVFVTDETTGNGGSAGTTDSADNGETTNGETQPPELPDIDLTEPDPNSYPQYMIHTLILGTVSPYEQTVGKIRFLVSSDAETYAGGAQIVLSVTLTNVGTETVTYDLESGIRCTATGKNPETWTEPVSLTLPVGASRTVELTYETPMTERFWLEDQIADYEILLCLRDPLSEVIRIRCAVPLTEEAIPLHSFDEEFAEAVRQVYLAEVGEEYADSTVTLRSVASLNGVEILFIDCDAFDYPDVITTETVDGLEFVYENGQTMTVYYDSVLYDLQSALDMGVLTSENIAELHVLWSNAGTSAE